MAALIRITDETTVPEIDEAIVSLDAARVGADPVRHEVLTERIDALLERRLVLSVGAASRRMPTPVGAEE